MSTQKTRFPIKRIALDAVLAALYIGLALLSITLFNTLKITFEGLPIIICALIFGPVDAAIVGFLGELLNQILTFGFTPTTLLWILPAVVRGLFVGICMLSLKKKIHTAEFRKGAGIVIYYIVCLISGILVSCINTFTLYVDSNMFGYYSYAMVFGAFWLRIVTGLVSSALMATAALPVMKALKKAKIIS